jgi:hypothetical protein
VATTTPKSDKKTSGDEGKKAKTAAKSTKPNTAKKAVVNGKKQKGEAAFKKLT